VGERSAGVAILIHKRPFVLPSPLPSLNVVQALEPRALEALARINRKLQAA
jgi:hypothetical protein